MSQLRAAVATRGAFAPRLAPAAGEADAVRGLARALLDDWVAREAQSAARACAARNRRAPLKRPARKGIGLCGMKKGGGASLGRGLAVARDVPVVEDECDDAADHLRLVAHGMDRKRAHGLKGDDAPRSPFARGRDPRRFVQDGPVFSLVLATAEPAATARELSALAFLAARHAALEEDSDVVDLAARDVALRAPVAATDLGTDAVAIVGSRAGTTPRTDPRGSGRRDPHRCGPFPAIPRERAPRTDPRRRRDDPSPQNIHVPATAPPRSPTDGPHAPPQRRGDPCG